MPDLPAFVPLADLLHQDNLYWDCFRRGRLTALRLGLATPRTLVVTAAAFRHFTEATHIAGQITSQLRLLDPSDPQAVAALCRRLQPLILDTPLPRPLFTQLSQVYPHYFM